MTKADKKAAQQEVLDKAVEHHYATATFNPSKSFPLTFNRETLFTDEFPAHPVKKWVGKELEKKPARFSLTGLAFVPFGIPGFAMIPFIPIPAMGSTALMGPMGLSIGLVILGGIALGSTAISFYNGDVDLYNATLFHKSKAKNQAFINWAKARYGVEFNEANVATLWDNPDEPSFIENGDTLYLFDVKTDSKRVAKGLLSFASAGQTVNYRIKKKQLVALPQGEVPILADAQREIEYLNA